MSVKFWRPGTVAPGSALEREEEGNTINVRNNKLYLLLINISRIYKLIKE
jgi:hypothetical protein